MDCLGLRSEKPSTSTRSAGTVVSCSLGLSALTGEKPRCFENAIWWMKLRMQSTGSRAEKLSVSKVLLGIITDITTWASLCPFWGLTSSANPWMNTT